jgi:creatinine amidohydrolase
MTVTRWQHLTRDELAELAPRAVTILPVAATEQHGPHLATSTDTTLVTAVAEAACARVARSTTVLLAPTLCFGASDHHLRFGATLSLTTTTLRAVLTDLVRSIARAGCRRVLLLNGHGGNATTCDLVASEAATAEDVVVGSTSYWRLVAPPPELRGRFPGHAGAVETALMLAVAPELVHRDRERPSPGAIAPSPEGLQIAEPDLWERIDGFSDDPREASGELGRQLLDAIATATAAAIDALAER